MRNVVLFFGTILFVSTILTNCNNKENLIYGEWFLHSKNNKIKFTEDGKIYAKKGSEMLEGKTLLNFEYVGDFDFNEEKKSLTFKNCTKSSDNGTFKVLYLDDNQLILERAGRTLAFTRL